MTQRKSIPVCIILTIITCGIYGIYWFITLTDDVARLSEDSSMSGGKAFLFTIITCGIYGFYWAYKLGTNVAIAKQKAGNQNPDSSAVVYLILQIFGLGIIVYGLAQNEINNLSPTQNA